jgi:hypothetical protein
MPGEDKRYSAQRGVEFVGFVIRIGKGWLAETPSFSTRREALESLEHATWRRAQ